MIQQLQQQQHSYTITTFHTDDSETQLTATVINQSMSMSNHSMSKTFIGSAVYR